MSKIRNNWRFWWDDVKKRNILNIGRERDLIGHIIPGDR